MGGNGSESSRHNREGAVTDFRCEFALRDGPTDKKGWRCQIGNVTKNPESRGPTGIKTYAYLLISGFFFILVST